MANANCRIGLGQVVQVLRGRQSGDYAIVIKKETGYVWLADGKSCTVEHPKKKNIKHIQPTNRVIKEIAIALNESRCVENAKLRYALNRYQLPMKDNL